MDAETISETLQAMANDRLARTRGKELRSLKGARGVPDGEIARIAAAAWQDSPPTLDSEDELAQLFRSAWEDGIVAVGLLAAMLPDAPADVADIAIDWLSRTDDTGTADALGWNVLGPAVLCGAVDVGRLVAIGKNASHAAPRRAVVMAAMAWLPVPIEGPAAAPLRERMKSRTVAFVEEPQSEAVHTVLTAFLRDEAPQVRKAMRRVLRSWTVVDPAAVVAWGSGTPGGLPKMLKEEYLKAHRRLNRLQKQEASEP